MNLFQNYCPLYMLSKVNVIKIKKNDFHKTELGGQDILGYIGVISAKNKFLENHLPTKY